MNRVSHCKSPKALFRSPEACGITLEEPCDKCRRKQTKRAETSGRFREKARLYKLTDRIKNIRSSNSRNDQKVCLFFMLLMSSSVLFHALSLLLAVGVSLAQNCPTCGQNPPLITTTATPQTAKIRVVLNAPSSVCPLFCPK